MVLFLFERNIIIYTLIGLCGLGLITRFIIDLVYKRLIKEADNIGATKNLLLKHMKMKFETCYRLKIGVNNVDTFVDKNVLRYRFCGILLSTWENFGGQVLFLSLLLVPISAVFGVRFDCGQNQILMTGAVGILTSSVLILVDKSINLFVKKRVLKLNILDYLENFCKVRLEQETFHPELMEQYRREYFEVKEAGKQISAATAPVKIEPKDELDRRREVRQRKEEEKRLQAAKREEEQRKIEEVRKEEERRRLEERKKIAAKRREEELQKLEDEREALEARRIEARKKVEGKQQVIERKQTKSEEKEKLLQSLEEDLISPDGINDMDMLMQGIAEIAAEEKKHQQNSAGKHKNQGMSEQEEKLIEDILKEFFA